MNRPGAAKPSALEELLHPPTHGLPGDRYWLLGALSVGLLFAARSMAPAFSSQVVQDDARQYVFWMASFHDPDLFRNDLIAEYYRAVTPPGYTAFYWVLSWVVDPLLVSKLLPPLLGAALVVFTFLFVRRVHPEPASAYVAAVLVAWYAWQYDDLVSATPRAFLLPLMAAQLWALAAERSLLAALIVVLSALLYPVAAVLGLALLGTQLLVWRGGKPRVRWEWRSWRTFLVGGLLCGSLLLVDRLDSEKFGPQVTADQARAMPEFGPGGRTAYFEGNALEFWLASPRSGLDLRITDRLLPRVPILFEYLLLASLLPVLWVWRPPGVGPIGAPGVLLVQLLGVSFAIFLLAHLMIFDLYLPSRYVKWSVPLVLGIAAGLSIGLLAEQAAWRGGMRRRQLIIGTLAVSFSLALALYPAAYNGAFTADRSPAITSFLRTQPKSTLVAGLPSETDSVPIFAARRILTSREHVIPYHLGYYVPMRERTEQLIEAYYSDSPVVLADLAANYGVDLFLVNRAAFEVSTFVNPSTGRARVEWEPFTSNIVTRINSSQRFVLLESIGACAVVDDGQVAVVPASCLATQPAASPGRDLG